jgi:IS30 family transposase
MFRTIRGNQHIDRKTQSNHMAYLQSLAAWLKREHQRPMHQYFPRGTDFSRISQSYLNAIALQLNHRPRKNLGFETPANKLQAVLH